MLQWRLKIPCATTKTAQSTKFKKITTLPPCPLNFLYPFPPTFFFLTPPDSCVLLSYLLIVLLSFRASQMAQQIKNPPAMQEMQADMGSIPGWGRFPGEEHGEPLLYSCLENPMDRGAWWVTVHRVTKSQTQIKWLSAHFCHSNRNSLRRDFFVFLSCPIHWWILSA